MIESINQLLHHLDVGSVRSSTVEGSVSVVKDDGAFSLESHTFLFKVGQVDGILVTLLKSCDKLWSSLISPGLILHGVDNEHTLWDRLPLVAGEPVWEY